MNSLKSSLEAIRKRLGGVPCGTDFAHVMVSTVALRDLLDAIEVLESALKGLLTDTQHVDHDCGDEVCAVDYARKALVEASAILAGEGSCE